MPRHLFPLRFFLCLLLFWSLTACAGKKQKEEKAAAIVPVAPREVGKVALVNPTMGFVLIDVDMGYTPLSGVALKTFPAGMDPAEEGETSILTVSPERRPPFIAADIVKGEPRKGDAVYQ